MGWKEAQKRYRENRTLNSQSTEDKVARRVLRGLGLIQRQLPDVERRLLGEPRFDEALWPRTLAVWRAAMRHAGRSSDFKVEVIETDMRRNHNDVVERCELVMPEDVHKPVFLSVHQACVKGVAYAPMLPEHVGRCTPPYKVIDVVNGLHIVLQEIAHYVKTNGPYSLEGFEE